MNKKTGFTLVELVVSAMILVIIVIMFGTIFKQVVIFIEYSRQQFSMLNEVTSIKQAISESYANKKIKLLRKESNTATGLYSVKDTVITFPNPKSKDVLIFQDINENSPDIYVMGIVDKKTKKLFHEDEDESGMFAIEKISSGSVSEMDEIFDMEFKNYINRNLNILSFKHTIINDGVFVRIDIEYDNNIDDTIKDKTNDDFYYTGSIHMIKKLD